MDAHLEPHRPEGACSHVMIAAGLKAPVRPRIRTDIWIKLWGNVCFNPLSALTGATLDVLATDPELAPLVMGLMSEARAVGEAVGIDFLIDTQKRIAGAAEAGAHKTSMLQDLESGRPMEIDPIVGAEGRPPGSKGDTSCSPTGWV